MNFTAEFDHKPYLTHDQLVYHRQELLRAQDAINESLKDFPDFDGIQFIRNERNHILLYGCHKQITKHYFIGPFDIDPECDNLDDVVDAFIENWEEKDTPNTVDWEKRFFP